MDEKKGFFELLSPKSALVVGLLGGVLTLGTIGFIVLGIMVWHGSMTADSSSAVVADSGAAAQQPAAQQAQQAAAAPVVPKSDKPKVELFVMAYCPYGLQMEKSFLPAWNLLKSKADINIEFVSYAMHGKREVDENTRQYCIEKNQPTKYQAYLQCFFSAGDNTLYNNTNAADFQSCLTKANINTTQLNSCIASTDKQYSITAKYNDQSTWLSGQYPQYPIDATLNTQYGVQGSPTLVINGVQANPNRTAESIKEAICAAFNTPPAECNQALDNTQYSAGFGMTTDGTAAAAGGAAAAAAPGCGT